MPQVNRTLAIVHTTAVTIEPLKVLAAELLPGCPVYNWLDDSILPQLVRGGTLEQVADRWLHYVHFASRAGADLVLSACSSVGELVPRARAQIRVPVLRIDEPMAELAVQRGGRIGVAATVRSTLEPTLALLRDKAIAAGRPPVAIEPLLVDSAFERLAAGDQAGHDRLLAGALTELAARSDVVVLAQASMARVLTTLPAGSESKFLTSPRLAMQRARQILEERAIS